jgi:hypothetical protein
MIIEPEIIEQNFDKTVGFVKAASSATKRWCGRKLPRKLQYYRSCVKTTKMCKSPTKIFTSQHDAFAPGLRAW